MRDLSGSKIGKLKVEELIVARPYSKKAYRCICDCGNEVTRLESTLISNRNSSCGCYIKTFLKPGTKELCSKAGKNRKNAFVNGSNVQMTFREGTIKGNTSGIQGVSWSGTAHKWHVYVGYQSYRANLGYFVDKDVAIKVRKEAEQRIKDGTFEEFFYEMRGFKLEEKLQKQFKKGR